MVVYQLLHDRDWVVFVLHCTLNSVEQRGVPRHQEQWSKTITVPTVDIQVVLPRLKRMEDSLITLISCRIVVLTFSERLTETASPNHADCSKA